MNKNFKALSVLLVLILLFQTLSIGINSFAADVTEYKIYTEADFKNLQNSAKTLDSETNTYTLSGKISLQNDITFTGFDKDITFTGTIEGNGHTIKVTDVYDGSKTGYQYGLFWGIKNSLIENLNIEINGKYSCFTGIFYKIKDCQFDEFNFNISNSPLTLINSSYTPYVGGIAAIASGTNVINLVGDNYFSLSISDNENRIAGGVIGNILDGKTTIYIKNDISFSVCNNSGYQTYGGSVGSVASNAELTIIGDSNLEYKLPDSNKSVNTNNSTLILGISVGYTASNSITNIVYTTQNRKLVISDKNNQNVKKIVTGTVGDNKGNLNVYGNTILIELSDFEMDSLQEFVMGTVAGNNTGTINAHSNGGNIEGSIIVPNATVKVGGLIGNNDGVLTLADNGIHVQIDKYESKSYNNGFIIGYTLNTDNLNVKYNIINSVDENSMKIEYNFLTLPIGNISKTKVISGFKNNYAGYMKYAELNKATRIYEVVPMNFYGDSPATMDDSSFPFKATYTYYKTDDENNQYLTLNNSNENGIGTVTLTKSCIVGVNTIFKVVATDADVSWTGHFYINPNILNYSNHNTNNSTGIATAIIVGGINSGEPLPTFNTSSRSTVKFNYFNLPYEIVYNNKSFNDISGQLYESDIVEAANRLIVYGTGNDMFEPDRPITRAEFAAMVIRALGLIPTGKQTFSDVPKDYWACNYINAAASWGIVYGIGDGTYLPNRNITRQEAMLILTRTAKNLLEKNGFEMDTSTPWKESSFTDYNEVSDWAQRGANENLLYKIIEPRENKMAYSSYITRAETARAILQLMRNFEVIDKS